jgi:hypothetical protein
MSEVADVRGYTFSNGVLGQDRNEISGRKVAKGKVEGQLCCSSEKDRARGQLRNRTRDFGTLQAGEALSLGQINHLAA